MKTMKKTIFALLMLGTINVFATDLSIDNKDVNGITINNAIDDKVFEPIIKQNDEYINFGLTNPTKENIDIIITDGFGYELVNIQNLDDLFVKKTFDTSELPSGDYTITVKTSKNTFTRTITVK